MALSEAEVNALWEAYQRDRSLDDKNRLVVNYVYLVNRIVSRIMPVYNAYNSHDDLVGYGILGLIDAVDKFIPDKNVNFEAYASKRIKGEIIDNIRKQDWAPVSLRTRIKQIGDAFEALEMNNGGEVTDEQVAEKLGLDVGQVRSALEKSYMFNMVRFETLLQTNNNDTLRVVDAIEDDRALEPERQLDSKELKATLAKALSKLTDSERKVVALYYFEELMLKDIADLLGVTPARVSQLHSRALLKLRTALSKDYFEGSL